MFERRASRWRRLTHKNPDTPLIFCEPHLTLVAKWTALPCLIFWLSIMIAIWLFLFGWARIVSGHFLPTEIAMTILIGVASVVGIAACVSLIPYTAHR